MATYSTPISSATASRSSSTAVPCAIVETEFVKPGKGQAFTRIKYKNLKQWPRRGAYLQELERASRAADVVETDMQFLYRDGDDWNLMDPDTYEQVAANKPLPSVKSRIG